MLSGEFASSIHNRGHNDFLNQRCKIVRLLSIPMLNENRQERFTAYAETLHQRFKKGVLKTMQDKPLWCLYKLEQDE